MLSLRLISLAILLAVIFGGAAPAHADEASEKSALEIQCSTGDAYSCLLAGTKLAREGKPGARAALTQACKASMFQACSRLGELLLTGVDGPVDLPGARSAYESACFNGAQSCSSLAAMYRKGEGGPVSAAAALGLYADACATLDRESCFYWGDMLAAGEGAQPDPAAAQKAFRWACPDENGYAAACERLN